MTTEFKLPELGENILSADVVKILVSEGESVEKDQILFEIETDKATIEVPSDYAGTIQKIYVKEGDSVEVGKTVMSIKRSAGKAVEKPDEADSEKQVEETAKPVEKVSAVEIGNEKVKESSPPETIKKPLEKVGFANIAPAAPSVRRFAREIGVDIHSVRGSGASGRISIEDVKAYAKNINEKLSASSASGIPIGIKPEALPDFSKLGEIEVQPMSNVRKKTAEHLSYAWSTIPHVTQFDKADITELEKFRKQYSKQVEAAGGKLTITSILLKVAAAALSKFPKFNSSIDMEKKEIIYKKYFNIGVAVDTPKGLLVPVIREVDKKTITQLSVELTELSEKARKGKLMPDEMSGGNFSISNLGGIGGAAFNPIVNSPEVAILGVSRGSYEAVLADNEFVPKLLLPLSLSYDHRIIDGADAARFLRWVCDGLENYITTLL